MIVNDDEILFAKVKENAQIPSKKEEDAGYDFMRVLKKISL